jgi:DNA-binding CsgD family transcriptional regulator
MFMTIVQENRIKIITFFILISTSLFAMYDIILDINEGVSLTHLIHEGLLWLFSMIGAIYQFRVIKWQTSKMYDYKVQINALGTMNEKLKLEHLDFQKKISHISNEFLTHIDDEFNRWQFSRAEKEIALLLIKGLAMKDIAEIRGSSENTVRQQASHIYKKSSLNGRLELSAYFLDDLLAISNLPSNAF